MLTPPLGPALETWAGCWAGAMEGAFCALHTPEPVAKQGGLEGEPCLVPPPEVFPGYTSDMKLHCFSRLGPTGPGGLEVAKSWTGACPGTPDDARIL